MAEVTTSETSLGMILLFAYWLNALIVANILYMVGSYKSREEKMNLPYLGWLWLASVNLGSTLLIFLIPIFGGKISEFPFLLLIFTVNVVSLILLVMPKRSQENVKLAITMVSAIYVYLILNPLGSYLFDPSSSKYHTGVNAYTNNSFSTILLILFLQLTIFLAIAVSSKDKMSTFIKETTSKYHFLLTDQQQQHRIYTIIFEFLENWIYSVPPTFQANEFSKMTKRALKNGKKEISEKLYLADIRVENQDELSQTMIDIFIFDFIGQLEPIYMKRRNEFLAVNQAEIPRKKIQQQYSFTKKAASELAEIPVKPPNPSTKKPTEIDEIEKPKGYVEIPGIGLVLACCHQTARLGETYCTCGRFVSPNLIAHFKG